MEVNYTVHNVYTVFLSFPYLYVSLYMFVPLRGAISVLVLTDIMPNACLGDLVLLGGGLCFVPEVFPGKVNPGTSRCHGSASPSLGSIHTSVAFSGNFLTLHYSHH